MDHHFKAERLDGEMVSRLRIQSLRLPSVKSAKFNRSNNGDNGLVGNWTYHCTAQNGEGLTGLATTVISVTTVEGNLLQLIVDSF